MKGLQEIKRMSEIDRKTKIVFVPLFKSYSDIFVLHYINYVADLEFGFSFIVNKDNPKVTFINKMLSQLGYFNLS